MIWSNTASVFESTPSSTRNWFIGVSIDARACLQASLERVVVSLQSISVEKGTLTIFSLTLSLAPLSNVLCGPYRTVDEVRDSSDFRTGGACHESFGDRHGWGLSSRSLACCKDANIVRKRGNALQNRLLRICLALPIRAAAACRIMPLVSIILLFSLALATLFLRGSPASYNHCDRSRCHQTRGFQHHAQWNQCGPLERGCPSSFHEELIPCHAA